MTSAISTLYVFSCSGFLFERGDGNGDGEISLPDAIFILSALFVGGSLPCEDAADVTDDGNVDISDPISLLGYLFNGGPPPPPPLGSCGDDPTLDALECQSPSCP